MTKLSRAQIEALELLERRHPRGVHSGCLACPQRTADALLRTGLATSFMSGSLYITDEGRAWLKAHRKVAQ